MKTHTLRFVASTSKDVLEHRARVISIHDQFSYDAPYSIVRPGSDNELEIPTDAFVYVTAADAFNESDPLRLRLIDMARIGKKTLRFTPSASQDAVGYRVYILKDGVEFDFTQVYQEITDPKNGEKIVVDIGSLPNAPTEEGVYDTYITAIDANGNESDPLVIQDSTFDFVAPEAPTDGEIV